MLSTDLNNQTLGLISSLAGITYDILIFRLLTLFLSTYLFQYYYQLA